MNWKSRLNTNRQTKGAEISCLTLSRRTKINRIFFGAVLIAWMTMIFTMSAMQAPASGQMSTRIARTAVEAFVPGYSDASADMQSDILFSADHFVRKTAHFTEYMLLGVFAALFFFCYEWSSKSRIFAALLVCMVYAVSDEVHQIFVLGRGPMAGDVFLDWAGSAFGVMMVLTIRGGSFKRNRM